MYRIVSLGRIKLWMHFWINYNWELLFSISFKYWGIMRVSIVLSFFNFFYIFSAFSFEAGQALYETPFEDFWMFYVSFWDAFSFFFFSFLSSLGYCSPCVYLSFFFWACFWCQASIFFLSASVIFLPLLSGWAVSLMGISQK